MIDENELIEADEELEVDADDIDVDDEEDEFLTED